jgi:AsmA family
MIRLRKYGGIAMVLLILLVGTQVGASLLMRTHRVRGYLIAHLENAFGRPVQAGRFSVQILPIPEVDVEGVTIGEDPAFGNEYFLRAEQMAARFRWLGLLRGRIEFGTMSFTRPSLILVRNREGRWNLEGWLPPARLVADGINSTGRNAPRADATHHLQTIDFDDGRINFKQGDEKRPFAFTDVSGSVEQISPGRWQLELKAQPWRSGVALQSTGTVQVTGYVAGTSSRLQPAQLHVHWGKVSLADLFRLVTGNDSGVRGDFALDGNASVGLGAPVPDTTVNPWLFSLQARATDIHRWDLNEREDNPRINVEVKGHWELPMGEARAEELRVELPGSNLEGSAVLQTKGKIEWRSQFQRVAVQGQDLLAWYRAFQPDVAEDVALSDFIAGSVTVSGWPLLFEDGDIASSSGTLQLPGRSVARLEPSHTTIRKGQINLGSLRIRIPSEALAKAAAQKADKIPSKGRPNSVLENSVEVQLAHDSIAQIGNLQLNLDLTDTASLFTLTSAFGHPLNKGWEYEGGVGGFFDWSWGKAPVWDTRNGSIELRKGRLQIAGLNEPLKFEDTKLDWQNGICIAAIAKAEAFGAQWAGKIVRSPGIEGIDGNVWHFSLHADHLDAAELDRWIGPRSRPNWLQRLLPSLLGSTDTTRASELMRQIAADGDLEVDNLTIEKIKLAKARANLSIHDFHLDIHDAEAQWAGGTVRGGIKAVFSPQPKYEIHSNFENVNMSQLPWPQRWAERWSGLASGTIHLSTTGVGREELLKELAGGGDLKMTKVEFRGWDVELSAESGGPSGVSSKWTSGEGEFRLSNQKLALDGFRLNAPHQSTQLSGTISFGMDGNLTFAPKPRALPGTHTLAQARELRLSGRLDSPEVAVLPVGAEQTTP